MRKLLCFFLIFSSLKVFGQINNIGSGYALRFDGINDYVDLGNIYDDLTFPFTVSAWIYLDPTTNFPAPILVSQDNSPIYNGFWFIASPTALFIEFGDGQGENLPIYRKGKVSYQSNMVGRWNHVCAVVRGQYDISLYMNGYNIGGSPSGDSNLPMASNFPLDVAKIGYFLSNGVTYRFKGDMDELRVWNLALSETEIRDSMCKKLTGNETGLIGYWTFDETTGNILSDKSPNNFNGNLIGNPLRVFSGAPLGDKSVYTYTTAWTNSSLSLAENTDKLTVNNVKGSPYGVHLYLVNDLPSQTGGLDLPIIKKPYFGVFIASDDLNNTYDVSYVRDGNQSCQNYLRNNNSVSSWSLVNTPLQSRLQRDEIVFFPGEEVNIDLGADKVLCDVTSYSLRSGVTDPQVSLVWSNGQTTPDITINQTGTYWVKALKSCANKTDTIHVVMDKTPQRILLPEDFSSCSIPTVILTPTVEPPGIPISWQDGSTDATYQVSEFGLYWAVARNVCGEVRDSVRFFQLPSPEIPLNLGEDKVLCDENTYTLNTGVTDPQVVTAWSTGQTTREIKITKTGTYWVSISKYCSTVNDTVHIVMEKTPRRVVLPEDQELCSVTSITLSPITDLAEIEFTWQDGTRGATYEVSDFGSYWVVANNLCGEVKDTVTFSRINLPDDKIPNVITPNGDNKNDYFLIDERLKGLVAIVVFNRWGELVYQSDSYNNDWKGDDISGGVYFYRISAPCLGEKKGSISVLK